MSEILQAIFDRRSIRSFQEAQISEDELSKILDAGIAAPSSMNRQPWHFTVIQDKGILDWMVETNRQIVLDSPELVKINGWINAPNYNNFYKAPTVILISGLKENIWHVCDCALAMENMALAAQALSIGSCIVVSTRFLFTDEKAVDYMEKLGIPDGYAPLYALALGYVSGENPQPTPREKDCINYIRG